MNVRLAFSLTLSAALMVGSLLAPRDANGVDRPNILFIAVDDLRPEIACYDHPEMVTPNLDRLANHGVRFDHAYCNIAVCGASRASLMKGLRPNPNRFTSYLTRADKDAPNVPSLPMTLKENGYHTVSNGKIYHHRNDDIDAWSETPWSQPTTSMWWAIPENRPKTNNSKQRGPAFESADVPDDQYPDHQICSKTIEDIQRLSKQDAPFFVACGFYRPHLPFNAPKKYWDLYPESQVVLPNNMYFPENLSQAFAYTWGEMRAYRDIPAKGPVSEATARNLVRGYHACVSFIDVQIGRLLDELESLGIADNTIVVLWGDHGWQLGEHGFWCKHTNFEVATHTPLMIVAPEVQGDRVCQKLVEYVDIYPTLCDLAGVGKPSHLQGKSMTTLLHDVDSDFKDAVITRHGGGDSIRTSDFRYMEMRAQGGKGELQGVGLFDLRNNASENEDVSGETRYAPVLDALQTSLDLARKASSQE
ncbi:sulfatase [Novipirellula artificiosorum]|uniref:Arylsulfatase n=1 Tax=Novipirellula artificiosorum TaxID=2528016 RepID=A0A5C6E366_9BACT|nr:sulfatase [Novipirellula artificiosorum]TWU41836.1 Arylsulfatase [Novipirellula artificiosorum]